MGTKLKPPPSRLDPRWDNNVPWCQEQCASHDGKRCRILGYRPDTVCVPGVQRLMTREIVPEDLPKQQLAELRNIRVVLELIARRIEDATHK